METFDYVVVGGGTSGCVAAAKLASTYNARVLLLEAGPDDAHALLRMPAGFIKMLKGSKDPEFSGINSPGATVRSEADCTASKRPGRRQDRQRCRFICAGVPPTGMPGEVSPDPTCGAGKPFFRTSLPRKAT